ncbi:MAG: Ig-like domain repeat protein [Curvibacter sp.]|nr:Ig-like domain repeat protein [Curvibacter sp.]
MKNLTLTIKSILGVILFVLLFTASAAARAQMAAGSLWANPSTSDQARLGTTLLAGLSIKASSPSLTPTSVKPVTATPNPQALGESMILATSVSPVPDGGSLTFYVNSTPIATVPLNVHGNAGTTFIAPAPGAYTTHAVYSGSSQYGSSTSPPWSISFVQPVQTSIQLTSSANPVIAKQSFSLTAQVSPANANGYVTFKIDHYVIGGSVLENGIARLDNIRASTLPVGADKTLTASFTPTSRAWQSSSTSLNQTIHLAWPTTLSLSSSGSAALVGQSLQLTAKLDLLPGSGAQWMDAKDATGLVSFNDGNTWLGSVMLSAGTAVLNVRLPQAGERRLFAAYIGDSNFAAADSNTLTQSVLPISDTGTTLRVSSSTVNVGQALQLTAQVTPPDVTGTVTFLDGSLVLGTAAVSDGQASLSTAFNTKGTHSLTASFVGSTPAFGSSTSAVAVVTVGLVSSSTLLRSSVNPSQVAQATTLSAVVTPATASGTITFKDGATTLATAPLSGGVATLMTNFNNAGTHELTASYAGDAYSSVSSSAPLHQLVQAQGKASTVTALASTANPVTLGAATVLTASVVPAEATGTVAFLDGATRLGSSLLSGGQASLTVNLNPVGSHSVTAAYSGDQQFSPSTSPALMQSVCPASGACATTLSLSASPNPVTVGGITTLTAAVDPGQAGGTVTFIDGDTTLGTASLATGVASLSTSFNGVGTHTLQARYAGASGWGASSSAPFSLKVTGGSTPTITYFHNDIAGTPLMATDAKGSQLWKESYRPYGERTLNNAAGTDNNKLWFTGKAYEASTGLSYLGARYYAPALGRFIGIDPKEVQAEDVHSFNRYAYANNNPFKYVDPDGREAVPNFPIPGSSVGLAGVTALGGYAWATQGQARAPNGAGMSGDIGVQNGRLYVESAIQFGGSLLGGEVLGAGLGGGFAAKTAATVEKEFFAGTKYTDKVLGQMKQGDFHAFPESVKGFQDAGQLSKLTGGDGVVRDMLKIPGKYKGKEGMFEFIKEADGSINHRLFKPNPRQ